MSTKFVVTPEDPLTTDVAEFKLLIKKVNDSRRHLESQGCDVDYIVQPYSGLSVAVTKRIKY